jgi:hypothetical protein
MHELGILGNITEHKIKQSNKVFKRNVVFEQFFNILVIEILDD